MVSERDFLTLQMGHKRGMYPFLLLSYLLMPARIGQQSQELRVPELEAVAGQLRQKQILRERLECNVFLRDPYV